MKVLEKNFEIAFERDKTLQKCFWKEGFIVDENQQFQKNIPVDLLISMDVEISSFSRFLLQIFEDKLGYTKEFQNLKKQEVFLSSKRRKILEDTTEYNIELTRKLFGIPPEKIYEDEEET